MKAIHVLNILLVILIFLVVCYGETWIQVNRPQPTTINIHVYGPYSSIIATQDELLIKDDDKRP